MRWLLPLIGASVGIYILTVGKVKTASFLFQGFKSFLGVKGYPTGISNNNPGNLRVSNSKWQGKIPLGDNTDGDFEQFIQYRYGIRALIKLLLKYNRDGHDTIKEIITRYAPPFDMNPTGRYIDFVEKRVGFGRNKVLTLNKATLQKLVFAITEFENGKIAVTPEDFEEAIVLV